LFEALAQSDKQARRTDRRESAAGELKLSFAHMEKTVGLRSQRV